MSNARHGFTLIELAIVLVIIGLIVGGVLVGQDLIQAARIRSVITDVEHYNGAALTFREKYGGLPGDIVNTKAVQYGFNTTATDPARNGTPGHGDGNGVVEGCEILQPADFGCEIVLFWVDLAKANLVGISPPYTSITAVTDDIPNSTALELGNNLIPRLKLRNTVNISVVGFWGSNYFALGAFNTIGNKYLNLYNNQDITGYSSGLTPIEAYAIDSKLDDGLATTGRIISVLGDPYTDDYTGSGLCADAGNHYPTTNQTIANQDRCSITIRAAF